MKAERTGAVTARVQELYELDETKFTALLQQASRAIQQHPDRFYELELYRPSLMTDDGLFTELPPQAGLEVYRLGADSRYVLLVETSELVTDRRHEHGLPYRVSQSPLQTAIIRNLRHIIHDWA